MLLSTRRILYFTAEERIVYRASGSGLAIDARFGAQDDGLAAFRDYLQRHRGALFAVAADLAGEDFHEEQIPFVRGADREALIARRLAQRYRDTRFALALSLGQVAGPERRNERVLLASFTNTQQLAPWVDALEEANTRLAGVYSVPLLAPALAARLAARAPHVLIVTADRAGLRQCFVENGRLRFARLERTSELDDEGLAGFVRSETHRLVQYLVTLRALPRDGRPVEVLVVAPSGRRGVFEPLLTPDSRLAFRTLDYADALKTLGVRRVPDDAGAEALFVHLAARRPPREQFATQQDRRRYLVWQLQRATVGVGAAALCVCALTAASRWWDAIDMRSETAERRDEARAAAQQYQRITSTFPVTDTSSENLKLAVVEFRRIAERSGSPERAFAHVSQVLERYPQFDIDSLRWRVGSATAPGEDAPKPAAAAGNAADSFVFVEVSGRVNATQRNDYRGITAQVQSFASMLVGNGYQVRRTQLPFDITSEGVLTGDIGAASDSTEAPRFTVLLARKLP